MEKYREHKRCNYCNCEKYSLVYKYPKNYYPHDKFITYSWDGGLDVDITLVKCNNCGLIYLNPMFKEEYLGMIYPESIIPNQINIENIINSSYNKYSGLVSIISNHTINNSEKIFFDIGARYGVMSELMRRKGYDAWGIELNKKCVKVANDAGLNKIINGTIHDLPSILKQKNINKVDIFSLDDVVEHLLDPSTDFKILNSCQEVGGYLFIKTMNWNSIGRILYGKDWYYIHSQHTYYFTEKSLKLMLEKCGYKLIDVIKPKWHLLLKNLPRQILKIRKHDKLRKNILNSINSEKVWFGDIRPKCNDLFIIVARKYAS
jgi:2-polyprenyl-3-methyl-5-hydroxy-6-metoxy-1,4-benzoquinol methylase